MTLEQELETRLHVAADHPSRRRSRKGRGSVYGPPRQTQHRNNVARSQSMRTLRRPQSLEPPSRQRGSSIPTDSDFQRLRNFMVTRKGIINRGDSFRSKSSLSSNSSEGSPELVISEVVPHELHRVAVLGAVDVGKTALTRQFTTSDYICSYDSSAEDENEKTVSIVLNNEESEITFTEYGTYSDQFQIRKPGAYVIVYSVIDRKSFVYAKELLTNLHKYRTMDKAAVILVGNKTDLARLRTVNTEEGRSLATSHGVKYIETSAGINHNVDELLVGSLTQVRLKGQQSLKDRSSECPGCKAKGLIKRILKKACARSRSCDNLHVL